MPYTGTAKFNRALFQSQAVLTNYSISIQNSTSKRRLTITFGYYLSNRIQTLLSTADSQLDFYKKNGYRAKRPEIILYPAFRGDSTADGRFWQVPKRKSEQSHQAIEYL
jgi:hypothetical protein